MTWFEIVISAFIVALVLYAMWKVGQLNPVGTGRLAQRMSQVERQFTELQLRVGGVEVSLSDLTEGGKKTNILVEAIQIELAADRGVNKQTWETVDRLQKWFMEEALKRITSS